jgi:PAS domain S-box-containing protein
MATRLTPRKIPLHLVLVFLLLALGVAVSGYVYFKNQKDHLKKEETEKLLAVADLKVQQIVEWRNERKQDAEAIIANAALVRQLRQWLRNEGLHGVKDEILAWMYSLRGGYGYDSLFLLDERGHVRLAASLGDPMVDERSRAVALEALKDRKIVFDDLFRDEKTGRIHLDIAVPIIAWLPDSLPAGVLLLRIDPNAFLYPLVLSWPTPSPTAESLLTRREKDEIVFLNEVRHKAGTALSLRRQIKGSMLPSALAVSGREGIVEAVDYRGVRVLAAIRAVPASPWYLISKVDIEEVEAPLRKQRAMIFLVAGLFILTVGLGVGFLWHREVSAFRENQYKAEIERNALAEHYQSLTKYANDIILLYNHELKIIEANERAVDSYGYTREELLRLDAISLRPPEARPSLDVTQREVETRKRLVFETLHQRKDGTTFPVEISVRLIEIDGKTFHQSIIRDITERKRAEEEIRRTQTFLSTIIENIPDMILIKDAKDFRFLACNKACEELTGHSREERIGKTVHDLFPKENADRFDAQDRELLERRVPIEVPDDFMDTKHRGRRALRTKKIPVFDRAGNPQYILTISEDVTERREAEEALRKSEERFRDLYDNAPVGYHEFDGEGRITHVNRTELEMMGYALEEMVGRPVWEYVIDPRVAREGVLAKLNGAMVPGQDLERVFRRKDGTFLPALLQDRLLRDERGQITGIRVTMQDITERKRAEVEREKLIHELQEALVKVKQLGGLLPICASCKKIRDDKGYWNQIETYIRDHSEAEFSHSICPDCMKKLYPEFAEEKER